MLITSTPVHGHVTPLLSVAASLVAAGDRVRFLTGARYRDAVVATGAEFLPLPDAADYDDSDMDAAFPGRRGLRGPAGIRYDMIEIFLKPVPAQLAAVRDALAAEKTDAILAESMFAGAAVLSGLPRSRRPLLVNLGMIPLGLKHPDVAPFGLGIKPMPGGLGRAAERLPDRDRREGSVRAGAALRERDRAGRDRSRAAALLPRLAEWRRPGRAVHACRIRVPAGGVA